MTESHTQAKGIFSSPYLYKQEITSVVQFNHPAEIY